MTNNLFGKHILNYSIEYEILNNKNIIIKFNTKQLKTFKRYAKKLSRLLEKMNKVGFEVKGQE